ncbi:ABC transporter substrate-binding protein [Streptomyces sp. NBC_00576]|uniref:ABC transporter substrate-binding protein n=1 Tax=Streptomyces sp. NBC_00576 TaxID=2903665 RepID=UPI002E80981C|nr:sugar ABC transporter substrate-binding protein [Streptomyces sp. NBC_00576]WUB68767.1 sugar ABC transporter substrate-binding protein [Streptomyces sp. NBC_00576]
MRSRTRKGTRRSAPTAITLTALLGLTATACGDNGSGIAGGEGGKGTITFWDNNTAVRRDIWLEIIRDFENEYPDIKVQYVGVPAENAQSKYDTAIQGGGLPDVGCVGAAMLAGIAAQDALEPLQDRLAESPLEGELSESMLKSTASAGGTSQLFMVPTSANNGVMYYRTDLFKAADLDAPTTWNKFYEAADRLTSQDKNRFGYTIRGGVGSIAPALDAMYGQSGIESFWNADETKTTVNDPRNVAALEKYMALYKKVTPAADLNNNFTQMVAQWDSGQIGMLSHNLGSYQDHVKALGTGKFRGLPNPKAAGGKRVQVSNPIDGLSIFKTSTKKKAAWKFIEYASSHKASSKFNESAGLIPANNAAAKDAWIEKSEPTRLAAEALNSPTTTIVQLPYYLPDWNTISKADNEPAFQKVMLGKASAKNFLDDLADQLNTAQADWKQRNG